MKQITTCPPNCQSNCQHRHHPLLVALLNSGDTNNFDQMQYRLQQLYDVIGIYKQRGWNIDDEICDTVLAYRLPLLYWACSLGCIAAAMLLRHLNASPNPKSENKCKSTALHLALYYLPSAVASDAIRKFTCLLPVCSEAIDVGDSDGNTPFHVCCRSIAECLSPYDFYCHCLESIIALAEENSIIGRLCLLRNNAGKTGLEFLCQSDRNLDYVRKLISFGADINELTSDGLSLLAHAKKCEQPKLTEYFQHLVSLQQLGDDSHNDGDHSYHLVSSLSGTSLRIADATNFNSSIEVNIRSPVGSIGTSRLLSPSSVSDDLVTLQLHAEDDKASRPSVAREAVTVPDKMNAEESTRLSAVDARLADLRSSHAQLLVNKSGVEEELHRHRAVVLSLELRQEELQKRMLELEKKINDAEDERTKYCIGDV